jgi:hypothetical protein
MRGRRFRLTFALGAALAATALAVPVASAGSLVGSLLPSCGVETTPFAQWGDRDGYCAFPNLGFEDGTAGWTLAGDASVVAANEPWNVSGPGAHALSLGPGAAVLSAALPVNLLDPWIRFFAQSAGASGALAVEVILRGPLGNLTGLLDVGSLSPGSYASWQPTQRVLSALALPLGTSSVQVFLRNEGPRGSWLLDDLYLDPCVSRVR